MFKKMLLSCGILLFVLGLFVPVHAQTGEIVYDASTFLDYKNRTVQDVANEYAKGRYAGITYRNGDSSTWYKTQASTSSPYDPGVLTEDTHKAMTGMANFYRWLVGLDPMKTVSVHSDSLQVQALVRNFDFNHFVDDSYKPADMSDSLWNAGAPCNHNIIAQLYTPQGAITGWMNEGYNTSQNEWDTVGHRYALISGTLSDTQFGYSGTIAIGNIESYDNVMDNPFAAFPAPGYMPNNVISPTSSSWTVELNDEVLVADREDSVTVKVTNLSSQKSYTCTAANDGVQIGTDLLNFKQPTDAKNGKYTDTYRVEISGLKDVQTGSAAGIRYEVMFTDITDYIPSYVTSTEDISEYVIYQSMSGENNLKKVAAILPKEIAVTAESGRKMKLPVKGKWRVDTKNKCFVNAGDSSKLPSGITDKDHILDKIAIPYRISKDAFDAYNSLSIRPESVKVGEPVRFSVYRTNISTDSSQIFQLTQEKDGSWRAVKRFDSKTSKEFSQEKESEYASPYHYYDVKSAKLKDGGEYLSVYFNSDDVNWGGITMYVSTSTARLNVSHKHAYQSSVTRAATTKKNGTLKKTCKLCGKMVTEKIYAAKKVKLSAAYYVVNGKTRKPKVTVTDSKGKKISSKYYTVTYPKKTVKAGRYTIQIKFKNRYAGTLSKKYDIVPKGTSLTSLEAVKKGFTAKWKKQSAITGYQIQYAANSKFRKAGTITIRKSRTLSCTKKKLSRKKRYYVRVRTYKTVKVSGKSVKLYSKWSKAKKVSAR